MEAGYPSSSLCPCSFQPGHTKEPDIPCPALPVLCWFAGGREPYLAAAVSFIQHCLCNYQQPQESRVPGRRFSSSGLASSLFPLLWLP
ncbi:hypothetical protein BS78_05G062700 [Paspalum vaginatum]|nr:hypothetical protein BS78_05G062700 [Paspalum vaginatum]